MWRLRTERYFLLHQVLYAVAMTQLKTIEHNHMSLECACGHGSLISIKKLLETLPPDTTIYTVAAKARCNCCGRRGARDFRLHYVCKTKEEL